MKAFQRLLVAAPAAALLPVALAPMGVLANDLNLDLDTVQEYSVAQGASIRDFSDVYPTDWAYQALAELVETYGCVKGYPDGTFRGDQPIIRYEVAAILNSCLEAMSAKMDMMEDDMDSMENMEMLKAEFSEELITLKATVDGLEAKVSTLEETQFSTTTKAEFEIATDFTYFSADSEDARGSTTSMEMEEVITPGKSTLVEGYQWDSRLNAGGLYSNYTADGSNTNDTYALIPVFYDEDDEDNRNGMIIDAVEGGTITFLINGEQNSNTATIPSAALNGSNTGHFAVVKRPRILTSNADTSNGIQASDVTYATNQLLTAERITLVNVPKNADGEDDYENATTEEVNTLEWLQENVEMTDDVTTMRPVPPTPYGEDNSGLALSSSVTIAFTTSFTGEDKLTFKLKGDVMSMENHYLALDNFYDVADNKDKNVNFTGFIYERNFDLGVPLTLTLGTDVDELAPIVGLDTYYGGGGYDGYGVSDHTGGDASGLGFNAALLDSDAGTVNFSASYSVAGSHATDQTGKKGLFGEDSKRAFAMALNWDGSLFGGNDARFTVGYQNASDKNMDNVMGHDLTKSMLHLVAGAYFTDAISFSGMYSFGRSDYTMMENKDLRQWMFALNMDDAFFPGNSAGIAYGTPEYATQMEGMNPTKVLELYYSFKVNDNFTVPIYLDFINNAGNPEMGNGTSANAFAFAVRPTLTF